MITVDMVAKAYEDKRTGRIAIEEDRRWGWSEEMIPEWIARLPPIEAGEAAGYRQHLHDLSYRELVYKYLSFYSSSGRVMPLYFALEGAPPEVFWPLLTEQWPGLDATWHISGCYLKMLRARPERSPSGGAIGTVPLSAAPGCRVREVVRLPPSWSLRKPCPRATTRPNMSHAGTRR
jgi:hypothetical protein